MPAGAIALAARRLPRAGTGAAGVVTRLAREFDDERPAVAELGEKGLLRPAEDFACEAGHGLQGRMRPEAGQDVLDQAVHQPTIHILLRGHVHAPEVEVAAQVEIHFGRLRGRGKK